MRLQASRNTLRKAKQNDGRAWLVEPFTGPESTNGRFDIMKKSNLLFFKVLWLSFLLFAAVLIH